MRNSACKSNWPHTHFKFKYLAVLRKNRVELEGEALNLQVKMFLQPSPIAASYAKWSKEQDGEHKWAVLILRAAVRSSEMSEELQVELFLLWPRKGVHESGLLGWMSIMKDMMGADPGQPDEIASLFWENLSNFPEELMEVESEGECLGFPSETALLLTLDIKSSKAKDKEQFKLPFISIPIHRTLI